MPKGLVWLQEHQDSNGRWDADGFQKHCSGSPKCGCHGADGHDVGISALALMAMIGRGNTHRVGRQKECVKRGLDWLLSQQREDGSFGHGTTESWIYDTALATMALCEACAVSGDSRLREPAQRAVNFLLKARNPGSGWRYKPNSGENDSSVTGWMVLALRTARIAGLDVPDSAFEGALAWFDSVTDKDGHTGYLEKGDPGSAIKGVNDHFTAQPTMVGVSVMCQLLCGRPRNHVNVRRGVEILMKHLPKWDSTSLRVVDMYYWYYGTCAMRAYGGPKWDTWKKAIKDALMPKQRVNGCADGSWEPDGKWGIVGGSIYATAINMLTLQVVEKSERVPEPAVVRLAQNQ